MVARVRGAQAREIGMGAAAVGTENENAHENRALPNEAVAGTAKHLDVLGGLFFELRTR
jgi:hypothetical protein